MNLHKERDLETEFISALSCTEAKALTMPHGYTAGKIRGAITRYCRNEEIDRPTTFCELKEFTPDFVDWWLDTNPEAHEGLAETRTVAAVDAYLAYTTVWKAKSKNNEVISSRYKIMASTHLLVKNSLASAIKAALSYNKRLPKTSQQEIIEAFPKAYLAILPATYSMQSGGFDPINNKQIDEIGSLIGGYFAKDKNVLDAVSGLKQLEAI